MNSPVWACLPAYLGAWADFLRFLQGLEPVCSERRFVHFIPGDRPRRVVAEKREPGGVRLQHYGRRDWVDPAVEVRRRLYVAVFSGAKHHLGGRMAAVVL